MLAEGFSSFRAGTPWLRFALSRESPRLGIFAISAAVVGCCGGFGESVKLAGLDSSDILGVEMPWSEKLSGSCMGPVTVASRRGSFLVGPSVLESFDEYDVCFVLGASSNLNFSSDRTPVRATWELTGSSEGLRSGSGTVYGDAVADPDRLPLASLRPNLLSVASLEGKRPFS